MADTGENRQIVGRVNAKAAETIRASKQMDAQEQSSEAASNATFGRAKKNLRRRLKVSRPPGTPQDSKA